MKPGRDLYSPVHTGADGTVTVELGADHPGFSDPDYRARRDAIASLAVGRRPGDPIPEVAYADIEHDVWKTVNAELARKHEQYATRSFLDGQAALDLPRDHIPQLTEVTSRLDPVTAFHYEPVAGLAPLRTFYGSFDQGEFLSTQYIRHVETDDALRMLSRVFWFTFEFGVVDEAGEIKTYGAGLLSSFGELDEFRGADIRPLDFAAMANVEYDITHYQPVLFSARSMSHLHDELATFLTGFTDEVPTRLAATRR
jgi:phenylalanine-4-hydroxylase